VTTHAASFGTAGEPAYHSQRHQAEATIAMGWLCAEARRLRLIDPDAAAAGVLAMAGHDLQHLGTWPGARVLEARSADLRVGIAAQAGLDESTPGAMRRVILATDLCRPQSERDAEDLLCRMAQEADEFSSPTPGLGWQLSQALANEALAAGQHFDPPVASFAGRLALLLSQRPATPPGVELGLADAVADQVAAMAVFGEGEPLEGAARLDALPIERTRADYLAALAAVEPG
jgi:hypothetical protein